VLQILIRLPAVLLVDGLRLLTADAEAAFPADEQRVGDLRVHVVETEVQVGGGEHLRFGLLPDQPQATGRAREDHGGDHAEKDSHDHRHHGHPADAVRRGPPAEPPGHGGPPAPVRTAQARKASRKAPPEKRTLSPGRRWQTPFRSSMSRILHMPPGAAAESAAFPVEPALSAQAGNTRIVLARLRFER